MIYAEKLRDPRWQQKRLDILNRDMWKCRECNEAEKTLNVHHLSYESPDPWGGDDNSLITLCDECHKEWHDKIHAIEKSIKSNSRTIFKTISNLTGFSLFLISMKVENIQSLEKTILLNIVSKYSESDSKQASYIVDCALILIEEIENG